MEKTTPFKKGSWKVNTKRELNPVIVVSVPSDVADMLDKFECSAIGSVRQTSTGYSVTFLPREMKNKGFDPEEYSCIYNLAGNPGSKVIKIFSDNEINEEIVFNGTCIESYSMRANKMTKQFDASILRLKHAASQTEQMHFLTDRERYELIQKQTRERCERLKEKDNFRQREREQKQFQKENRIATQNISKEKLRQRIVKLLNKHEYMTLQSISKELSLPKSFIEGTLKEVAEIQKNGKHMNAYKLLKNYKIK